MSKVEIYRRLDPPHTSWRQAMDAAAVTARVLGERRRVYRRPCGCWVSVLATPPRWAR